MYHILFAIPLIAHGLAHISGFFAAWTSADAGHAYRPWLFSANVTLDSPVGRGIVLNVLYLAIGVGLAMIFVRARRCEWHTAELR